MRVATILLALGVFVASCSSGGGPAEASPSQPTPSPSASPSPSESPTPEPSPSPTEDSGEPTAKFSPRAAPPGTRIHMTGTGFVEPSWPYGSGRQTTIILGLTGGGAPQGCQLVAEPIGRANIDEEGNLTGSFRMPRRGVCRQDFHEPPRQPKLVPGRYVVSLGCTACFVGSFRLTAE